MSACKHCRKRDAAPWDPDDICPACRGQISARAARRRGAIAADRATPGLPGLAAPRPAEGERA